ncbi:MAG: LL-diaminopimelate aminotransferase [Gammaproteobacteria bacterium]|nr:LL-diaminopimelate aminotransferase [Gammaproteobacteria bacterium]
MKFKRAERLLKLPTYVFAQLDALKAEERKKGVDLIDLGMGNPDIPPPKEVDQAILQAVKDAENHRYPSFEGLPEYRNAVAGWCKQQYGIDVDPVNEVATLIGSKEGLVHFAFAYLDPGDKVLVPMPAYPAHFRGPILAGADPVVLPTSEKTNYLVNLKEIDPALAKAAKILYLSYPTNPTAATAPKEFFEEAVAFARKYDLILIHDFAYAEVYFDGKKPPSCLSVKGARDCTIEFHTLSKTFGMAGWRCGFAVGNAELIDTLRTIKTNLDYGLFMVVQRAGIAAMSLKGDYTDRMRAAYQERRDLVVSGLNQLGWNVKKPQATMYIWVPVPRGFDGTSFSLHLLEKTGVVVAPGVSFGDLGEDYIRIALVDKEERLTEALERMKKAGIGY